MEKVSLIQRMFWKKQDRKSYSLLSSIDDANLAFWLNIRNGPNKVALAPKGPESVYEELSALMEEGFIKKGDSFFDFGSGIGSNLAIASYLGLYAEGIDLEPEMIDFSGALKKKLAAKKFYVDFNCAIGNYFTEEYLQYRREGKSKVEDLEQGIAKYRTGYLDFENGPFDAWSKLNKSVDEVDIFFAYLWGPELPPIAEMFSKYAKKDALLMISCPTRTSNPDYWHRLGIEEIKKDSDPDGFTYVFRKTEKIDDSKSVSFGELERFLVCRMH